MWKQTIVSLCQSLIFVFMSSAFFAIGVPKEIALSQTGAECGPKYEECISSCAKQNNSCYEGAGTDTDQIAGCDDQYTTCNEKCFRDFCRKERGEKSDK